MRNPDFEEGDIFKAIIPITPQVTPQVEDSRITKIIKFCKFLKVGMKFRSILELKIENILGNIISIH